MVWCSSQCSHSSWVVPSMNCSYCKAFFGLCNFIMFESCLPSGKYWTVFQKLKIKLEKVFRLIVEGEIYTWCRDCILSANPNHFQAESNRNVNFCSIYQSVMVLCCGRPWPTNLLIVTINMMCSYKKNTWEIIIRQS